MRQRVSLIRTLVHDPSVLLMDEPFGALDALTRLQVRTDLEALWLRRRPTVLFITHSVEEAVGLSDRILVMSPSPGEVVEEIDVELPRPRPIVLGDAPEFGAYVDRIHRHFERMGVLHGIDAPRTGKRVEHDRGTSLVGLKVDGTIAEIAISNGSINLVTKALLRALNGVLDRRRRARRRPLRDPPRRRRARILRRQRHQGVRRTARRRERAQDPVRGHGAAPSRAHADADDRRHRRHLRWAAASSWRSRATCACCGAASRWVSRSHASGDWRGTARCV